MSDIRQRTRDDYIPLSMVSDEEESLLPQKRVQSYQSSVEWQDTPKEKGISGISILVALFLFCVGIAFSTIGANITLNDSASEALPYLVIGSLTIIPGVYSVFLIIMISLKVDGYTTNMLPIIE